MEEGVCFGVKVKRGKPADDVAVKNWTIQTEAGKSIEKTTHPNMTLS